MAHKTVPVDAAKTRVVTLICEEVAIPGASTTAPVQDAPVLAEHEQWLAENAEARALIESGLEDIAAGRVTRMSFAKYADIDIEG